MTPEPQSTGPINTIHQNALALRAWETVSPERDLKGVLAAVSDLLLPVIPFDGIGIVFFSREVEHRLFVLHLVGGSRRPNESDQDFMMRATEPARRQPLPSHPQAAYDSSQQERMKSGEPYTCADIRAKPQWYPHEFRLAAAGIRAYLSLPLIVRGGPVGVATIGRRTPDEFTPDEIKVLRDVSQAFAVAVANALAYEEIRKLRDQLAAENLELKEQLGQTPWAQDLIGNSEPLRRVLEAIDQVAPTDATVLITGETGTGKELIARAIHLRSRRAHGPLVKMNCAAVPETLLASELFGHERGAFTGASERRKGRFEQAHTGTLFLDEIGDLPPEMQVLLLRVLQEREFERLGGAHTIQVDVRVIVATNRDLSEAVRDGRFREDLFYRLNVFPVHMPALRDRAEDIPLLVAHFAAKHGKRHGREIKRIDRRTLKMLESHAWPGNVRELENLVERAVIASRGGTLRLERSTLPFPGNPIALEDHLLNQERAAIEATLRSTRGRVSGPRGAAALLGLPSTTLESRIQRLGINKFQYRSSDRGGKAQAAQRNNSGQ